MKNQTSTKAGGKAKSKAKAGVRTRAARHELALAAVDAALEKKALEPLLLEVDELTSYTDFILIVSGTSDRQVGAIADGILARLREQGRRPIGTEGVGAGEAGWVLLDFGDLVVHVFNHPVREFYDLEGLWIDAPRVELDLPPEARAPTDVY